MAAEQETMDIALDTADTHVLLAGGFHGRGYPNAILTNTAVQGLYSTPTAKTALTERQSGNGAHDISDSDILYSARTVTVPFAILSDGVPVGDATESVLASERDVFARLAGHLVRLTVNDSGVLSYVTGYVTVAWSGQKHDQFDTGTLTVVCPDPVRYSLDVHSATLWPLSSGVQSSGRSDPSEGSTAFPGEGLFYRNGVLSYPISYSDPAKKPTDTVSGQNVVSLTNSGSTPAFPTLTAYAPLDSVRIDWVASDGTSGTLAWSGSMGSLPLVFDCRDHVVSSGSLDRTSRLTSRGFPRVPAHGSVRLVLMSAGTGYVTAVSHDTWI